MEALIEEIIIVFALPFIIIIIATISIISIIKMTNMNVIIIIMVTSSAAQGGGGSFKNRKPIGGVGCCESRMAERSH